MIHIMSIGYIFLSVCLVLVIYTIFVYTNVDHDDMSKSESMHDLTYDVDDYHMIVDRNDHNNEQPIIRNNYMFNWFPWWNSTRYTRNMSYDLRGDVPIHVKYIPSWYASPHIR